MAFSTLLLLTACNILNYLDRYLLNALMPLIQRDFNLTYAQSGLAVSSFVIGYVIFSPLFGYFGDRRNRIVLMTIGLCIWGAATFFTGLAGGFLSLIAARIFIGIGEASFGTLAPAYIKDTAAPKKLTNSLALFFAAIPVGSALGYAIAGFLREYISWQEIFYLCSAPTLLVAFFLIRVPEAESRPLSQDSFRVGVKEIIGIPLVVFSIVGYAANAFALNGIAAFISFLGEKNGFSLSEINLYFGLILVLTGFLGTIVGGRIATNYSQRFADPTKGLLYFCSLVTFIAVPFCIWAFFEEDKWFALGLFALVELLLFATISPINSVIVQACPSNRVALTQGLSILTLNLLGALPAPYLVGWASDSFGIRNGLQLTSIALLISGCLWMWGAKRKK